jgi:hypothetical protein
MKATKVVKVVKVKKRKLIETISVAVSPKAYYTYRSIAAAGEGSAEFRW